MFGLFFPKQKRNETRYAGVTTDLVLDRIEMINGVIKAVRFHIVLHGTMTSVGYCDLRFEMNEEMYYAGNIGYRIYTPYRGNSYAYDAAKVLLKVGFDVYGMDEIIITCSPENVPSRRTIEKLHGQLLETTAVPADHWLAQRGELVKNIYMFRKNDMER